MNIAASMTRPGVSFLQATGVVCACFVASFAMGAGDEDLTAIGYDDLVARLGAENVPTGATAPVAQCEADAGGSSWIPHIDDETQFGGKTFTIPWGDPNASSHAHSVGKKFFSNIISAAPGVNLIWLYEAGNFLGTGYLHTGQSGVDPEDPPHEDLRVINHSWVGQFNSSVDDEALRRADYLAIRDNILMCNGTRNGGDSDHIFAHAFNTLTVGASDGDHAAIDVPEGIDGPGRMKPEIVAPGNLTSYTSPIVASVAAFLNDTANTEEVLSQSVISYRLPVIKATLLAGCTQMAGWTNNPSTSGADRGETLRPIDDIFGAGMVNIDRSHQILTGYRQSGSSTLSEAPEIGETGWAWPRINYGVTKWWKFTVSNPLDQMVVVLTWPRVPTSTYGGYSLMDLNLEIVKVEDDLTSSIVGDAGLELFESGNVRSASLVDNIEMLVVKGLQPGDYAIKVDRTNVVQTTYAGIAWIMTPGAVLGDLNGDGMVDGADLTELLGAWGSNDAMADLDSNGLVDGGDLTILLGAWTS